FGLRLSAEDSPRFHEILSDTARRLDAPPVDRVYLAPGAGVTLTVEGRAPFGLFGVARRVLVVGLASLQWLTVRELQAILAQQLAPLSLRGSRAGRLAERLDRCHADLLETMWQTRSTFAKCNPFFWLLVLYCRCYRRCVTCLCAGFCRARRLRADR